MFIIYKLLHFSFLQILHSVHYLIKVRSHLGFRYMFWILSHTQVKPEAKWRTDTCIFNSIYLSQLITGNLQSVGQKRATISKEKSKSRLWTNSQGKQTAHLGWRGKEGQVCRLRFRWAAKLKNAMRKTGGQVRNDTHSKRCVRGHITWSTEVWPWRLNQNVTVWRIPYYWIFLAF